MRAGEPDRRRLPFAVSWTGWWRSESGPATIYLTAPQAGATVSLDGVPTLTATAQSGLVTAAVTPTAGWHRLHITLSSPYGAPREFSAGVMRAAGPEPFTGATLRTERVDSRQAAIAQVLSIIKPTADVMALAWLLALAGLVLIRRISELWQRRVDSVGPACAVYLAAATIDAMRFAWPWAERLRIMTAGDDTMVYEGYARDILLNGILMNGGLPLGQGEPFYFQAFYPYFLAASHALFGESFFGALLLQRLLVAVTAVILAAIATRIHGRAVWPTALTVATAFVYWKLAPISADLLSESLYVPLMAISVFLLMDAAARPGALTAARAGMVSGLTAITRSTAMLPWACLWVVLYRAVPRGTRTRVLGLVIGCTLAVFSLIAIRNALVSHRFVPASTGFGITLRGGNEPPGELVLNPAPHLSLYERFGVDGHTIDVIEYAITAPGSFASNMGRKVLFVLGFYEPYAPGWGYSPVYIAAWLGAMAGGWWLWRLGALSGAAAMPLIVAVTQFAMMAIVYPKGERLIVPVHTMWIPYASIAAYQLWVRATARSR